MYDFVLFFNYSLYLFWPISVLSSSNRPVAILTMGDYSSMSMFGLGHIHEDVESLGPEGGGEVIYLCGIVLVAPSSVITLQGWTT